MYVILIGAPGAGKGTQAMALADAFGLAHIATGDMFRAALSRGTPTGLRAKAFMDRGELVPDDVTTAMVVERLGEPDCIAGAILDGFPRNENQAVALEAALEKQGKCVSQALYLSVPDDELLRRMSGRWLCRVCQTPYHEVFNPPRERGKCDKDGGELYQREDDTIETARRRLKVFEQMMPVIDHYRAAGILNEIDGTQSIPEVKDALFETVRRRKSKI